MTKGTLLRTFKEILSKSNMKEIVIISENINKLADIVMY